jgi:hypothetical protein
VPSTVLLAVVGGGTGVGSLALLAQAVAEPSNIAPYVGGGVGVIAVGALAEVLRRMLNGRLIPREVKEVEAELGSAIIAAGQREDRMIRLVEETSRTVGNLADEVRRLRRHLEGSD